MKGGERGVRARDDTNLSQANFLLQTNELELLIGKEELKKIQYYHIE